MIEEKEVGLCSMQSLRTTRALTFSTHDPQDHLEHQHSVSRWETRENGNPRGLAFIGLTYKNFTCVLMLLVRTQLYEHT